MRFDTHRISALLINELQRGHPRLEVTYDGGDIIRVALPNNENVLIYLIETPITIYEIMGIVAANTAVGAYSLFILWCDLLLPVHGTRYRPNDWMAALMALHGDKIYAFDAYYGDEFYIFPVYFEGTGAERLIRHGGAIDATQLVGATVQIESPLMAGTWRMANFEPGEDTPQHVPTVVSALTVYFRRLGIAATTDREAIKGAYRRLARKFHPDLNTTAEATERMQAINEAYERILAALDQADDL